jgi:hypothetical protein
MAKISDIEGELAAVSEEEEAKRKQELEEQNQEERLRQAEIEEQERAEEDPSSVFGQAGNIAKEAAKEKVKQLSKKAVKQVGRKIAARAGSRAAIAATSEFWVPALVIVLVILLVLGLVFFVITSLVAACNQEGFSGILVRGLSSIGSTIGLTDDICGPLVFKGGDFGGGGAGGSFDIELVLTSAYRPGAITSKGLPSAHGRGEAIDVALRNPRVGFGSSDPRIASVVRIAEGLGFTPPAGDVIDEYNNPAGAEGPHIHIEFNDGFCSGAPAPSPPTDLKSLVGLVPIEGASDPRVRTCMLNSVLLLFEQVSGSSGS